MHRYQFIQQCEPRTNLRVDDILGFMKIVREAFETTEWVDGDGAVVPQESKSLERKLCSQATEADRARFGVVLVAKAWENNNAILLMIGVGGDQWSRQFFTVDFSRTQKLPDTSYFRRAIDLVRPFEAYILDEANANEIKALLKSHQLRPQHGRPYLLCWFHYMNDRVVKELGGVSLCLKTPEFRVEPFCNGLLFQQNTGPFCSTDAKQKDIQLRAMEHLGLV